MFVDISPGPVDYSKALVVFRGTDNCCYSSEESINQSITVKVGQFGEDRNDSEGTKTKFSPTTVILLCQPCVPACSREQEEGLLSFSSTCLLNPVIVCSHPSLNSKDIWKNPGGEMECGSERRMQITSHSCGYFNLYQLYLNHLFFYPANENMNLKH